MREFREEVRTWLEANCPASMRVPAGSDDDLYWGGRNASFASNDQRAWFERMADKGWIAPSWPREYGGAGLNPEQSEILREEMAALDCRPPLAGWGLTLLGPTLLRYGSEALKSEHLPAIARGEIRWCQGFSEPNAGSDLAAVATFAEETEGGFVVNGQKIWTTYGDKADKMFCVLRTDRSVPKREGISFLLIDMTSPGVRARPIMLISGSSEFCEVFFDDVFVPADQLVGVRNRGWEVTKYLLGCERELSGRIKAQGATALGVTLAAQGIRPGPVWRDRLARFDIEARGFAAMLSDAAKLANLGVERPGLGFAIKRAGAELNKARLELQMTAKGTDSLEWTGDGPQDGLLARTWLRTKANSIAGGSNEMQLNLVARHVLGLPGKEANRTGVAEAIDFDEDLRMIRQAARGTLNGFAGKADVRAMRGQPERNSAPLWQSLCEAGYAAVLAPEDLGGLPLGMSAASVIQQELGRALMRQPFLSSAIVGATGLRRCGNAALRDRLLPELAAGSLRLTLALEESAGHDPHAFRARLEPRGEAFVLSGAKRFVPDANGADVALVTAVLPSGEPCVLALPLDAPGVTIHSRDLIDEADWADIAFVDVDVPGDAILSAGDEARTVLEAMLDAGRIGAAAELLGLGDEACDRTVAYLKTRRQFDHYLAEYQALQHRIAYVHMQLELARAAVREAARKVDEGEDAAAPASAAKFLTGEAATLAAREAIQLHGGIAMTDDADIGFFIKRARVLCELYGDGDFHADRFAARLGY